MKPQQLAPIQTLLNREGCLFSVWLRVASTTCFPFMATLFFNHSVFWASTRPLKHLFLLLPFTAYIIGDHCLPQEHFVLQIQKKRKRKALMMLLYSLCLGSPIIIPSPFHLLWDVLNYPMPLQYLKDSCNCQTLTRCLDQPMNRIRLENLIYFTSRYFKTNAVSILSLPSWKLQAGNMPEIGQ